MASSGRASAGGRCRANPRACPVAPSAAGPEQRSCNPHTPGTAQAGGRSDSAGHKHLAIRQARASGAGSRETEGGPHDLITYFGKVFHCERLINSQKRQSHGKFVTLPSDDPGIYRGFNIIFNMLPVCGTAAGHGLLLRCVKPQLSRKRDTAGRAAVLSTFAHLRLARQQDNSPKDVDFRRPTLVRAAGAAHDSLMELMTRRPC